MWASWSSYKKPRCDSLFGLCFLGTLVAFPWASWSPWFATGAVFMAERSDNIRSLPGNLLMPRARRASSIKPERIQWLCPGRLAVGKITVLDGDPGLGKSQIGLEWAARITTGRALPGAEGWTDDDPVTSARGVLVLSAEDGEADTIVPRLIATGADMNRVILMDMVDQDGNASLPTLDGNLAAIESQIEAGNCALLIVDPLMAYLSSDVNSSRDQDVRRVLSPLSTMATRTGCAVLVLRHLNKSMGMASLYRGGGSIGIIGAARVGLLAAKDDDDQSGQRRILAVQKCNIGPEGPSLLYHVVPHLESDSSRVEWLGESAKTASQMLGPIQDQAEKDESSEAELWLADQLTNAGAPGVKVVELFRQGAQMGFNQKALRRAKHRIGGRAVKGPYSEGGGWAWSFPLDKLPPTAQPRFRTAAESAPKSDQDDQDDHLV